MADITSSIARTLKRLNVGGKVLDGVTWLPKLYTGLSKEFGRVRDYRKKVLAAAIPDENIPVESIDDLETKYGIENYLGLSDAQRIERIVARATGQGNGGLDWLQEQIQQAGFPLYVILNSVQPIMAMQYGGSSQYSVSAEYGQLLPRTNPASVLGKLIYSSPAEKAGRRYLSQYGTMQYGSTQYGTADPAYSYPAPREFTIPYLPLRWGKIFFLSPFPDRLATTDAELLSITAEAYRFFRKLVIQTKYLRDWCIAQVKVV
jgi:hypothetical protein